MLAEYTGAGGEINLYLATALVRVLGTAGRWEAAVAIFDMAGALRGGGGGGGGGGWGGGGGHTNL